MTRQEEMFKRFDERFTDNGNGWSNANIYRDGGRTIINNLKQFLQSEIDLALAERDKELVDEIEKMDYRDFEKVEQFLTKKEVLSLITKEKTCPSK